ncbi:MAG: 16S rRNA (cytidine(1402)-2'-O)-methyltransferase [Lentisphaerae bacterium]|nr:16S rRNA (cytidine(1402)-2'-O)-methyltransferase [Lentisphaerota bacterium]
MQPGLYLVGTPIGNLEDISARALSTLRGVGLILAEDTRHTRILLERYQIRAALISCHQHNEASRAALVLERIRAGEAVALVTNAGMPGVSDPGARIVRACRQAGIAVTVIPGASSVTAAVALCGFIAGGFHCEGFLPRKEGARKKKMQQLLAEPLPVVLMESPYRCLKVLSEWNEFAPERELFLARELTKLHEECLWGTVHDVYRQLAERANAPGERAVRGEIVMVLAPADAKAMAGRPAG